MKEVNLTRIEFSNFRSFVEPTAIDFSTSPGLKLISGNNEVEPKLGANGVGKSSLFDAVSWCISERSIKGLRTSDLISYEKKQTEVATDWNIDGESVRIFRTGPPSRVWINGDQVEQIEVDRLLGLSRVRFLNSVIFGQAVPLFIDLPVPARGDLLDEVLDLELWMQAAGKAHERHRDRDSELRALQTEIARLSGQLQGLPDISNLTELEKGWEKERRSRIRELFPRLRSIQSELKELQKPIKAVQVDVVTAKLNYDKQREVITRFERQGGGLRYSLNKTEEEIQFFDENDSCPTCGQEITVGFAKQHRKHLEDQKVDIEQQLADWSGKLEVAQRKLRNLESIWQRLGEEATNAQREQAIVKERIRSKTREIEDLQRQIEQIKNEVNPYTGQKATAIENKKRLEYELEGKRGEEQARISELAGLNYWRQGFRKVRLFCLDNVLEELAVETRNSLLALGLIDWKVNFKTATENKSGTVKLGVQVDVQPPNHKSNKFDVLSGGEGQRARLAGSLGLANLVQRWAGVKYGFEVFDEPTAWLSEQGVENLLDCLSYRASSYNKSIWVCDHRALLHGGFIESYMVTKDAGGSKWSRI